MKTSDFFYHLPNELIAQTPPNKRDASRMLVLNRATGELFDEFFTSLPHYLRSDDVLVRNTTRVIPARLFGVYNNSAMEFLLLKRIGGDDWEALVKPGKKAKIGREFIINEGFSATILKNTEFGGRIVRLKYDGIFEEVLERAGHVPLPPYITQTLDDKERYQTIYANERGSAAAPTAGLHFTPELISDIENKGVKIVDVLLHVGLGTFRPVSADNIDKHKMHSEYYQITESAANTINTAHRENRRVISVGTTSCRALESASDASGIVHAGSGFTDIFITPGYRFKAVDALITNFHLPESTLLMLVSAFYDREKVLNAYEHAVELEYRFFSFGDCMIIL